MHLVAKVANSLLSWITKTIASRWRGLIPPLNSGEVPSGVQGPVLGSTVRKRHRLTEASLAQGSFNGLKHLP